MVLIIPLGGSCSVAYQLQKLGLREKAYPFDWLRTPSLDIISKCIEEEFEDFAEFTPIKEVKSYPLLNQEDFDSNGSKTSFYATNKYGCQSYHDFDSRIPFEDQIQEVKEKYHRRIDRFLRDFYLREEILFVRECQSITQEEIDNFKALIPKDKKYQLKIIVRESSFPFRDDIIHDTNDYGDWTRPNLDWKQIFGVK